MMLDIRPKKGTKNIIITEGGCFKNVRRTKFCLVFDLGWADCENFFFVLDESVENDFQFSVQKDYEKEIIEVTISGAKKNNICLAGVKANG